MSDPTKVFTCAACTDTEGPCVKTGKITPERCTTNYKRLPKWELSKALREEVVENAVEEPEENRAAFAHSVEDVPEELRFDDEK